MGGKINVILYCTLMILLRTSKSALCKKYVIGCSANYCSDHYCGLISDVPITFDLADQLNGSLNVTYIYHAVEISKIQIILKVVNASTPEECAVNESDGVEHSTHKRHIEWCANNSCASYCKNETTVTFNYVYSACYKVYIRRFHGSNSLVGLETQNQWISTNYTKVMLQQLSPTVTYLKDSVTVESEGSPEKINISITMFKHSCNNSIVSGCQNSTFSYIRDSGQTTDTCLISNNNITSECVFCQPNDTCLIIKDNLKVQCFFYTYNDGTSLQKTSCSFRNYQPDIYEIQIEYIDPRCFRMTVWGNESCNWIGSHSPFPGDVRVGEKKYENDTLLKPPDFSLNFATIIITVVVFLIICGSFIYYIRRHNSPKKFPNSEIHNLIELNKEVDTNKQTKVLILYPRLCEPFMNCVSKLRDILRNKRCEVYDIWDSDLYSSILSNQWQWMDDLFKENDLDILVIDSEYSSHLKSYKDLPYKDPHCLDNLFIYGVNKIRALANYKRGKIFVISLFAKPVVNQEHSKSSLESLDYSRLFILPINLQKLICDIYGCSFGNYSVLTSDEEKSFNDVFQSYQSFVSRNPHFLNDIFEIEK